MSLRKLYLSSLDLEKTDQRIIDIAFKYRFSSQEAFSRAFRDVFGISPNNYRKHPQPLQSYIKLKINNIKDGYMMDISKKLKIEKLQNNIFDQFDQEILNILNGQAMYEEFNVHQLMEKSDYVPFNEAMCSHETCDTIFSDEFNQLRAMGHQVSLKEYENFTIAPLQPLFEKQYNCIVLWFGDDMFCQMNLLTVMAYLDQISIKGQYSFIWLKKKIMM